MAHLMIQNGRGIPQKHKLEGELITIGRHPENAVVLTDDSVSGHHADIVLNENGYTLRDLGSSNGTRLNGQSVQEAPIKDGDSITFGGIEATFVHENFEPQPVEASTGETERGCPPLLESEPESAVKHEVKDPNSTSSSFRHTVGKVMSDVGKVAQLAALKAKIEKLKRIDLNTAYYALGKKCYDQSLHRNQFAQQFEAIATLEKQIEEKSQSAPAPENETTGEKVKRIGAKALAETEAAALKLKLRQRLTGLGKEVMNAASDSKEVEQEYLAIAKVAESTQALEADAAKLGADFVTGLPSGSAQSLKSNRTWAGVVGITVAAFVLIFFVSTRRAHEATHTVSPQSGNSASSTTTPGADESDFASMRIIGRRHPELVERFRHGMAAHGVKIPQDIAEYQVGKFTIETDVQRQWRPETTIQDTIDLYIRSYFH